MQGKDSRKENEDRGTEGKHICIFEFSSSLKCHFIVSSAAALMLFCSLSNNKAGCPFEVFEIFYTGLFTLQKCNVLFFSSLYRINLCFLTHSSSENYVGHRLEDREARK